MLPLQLNDYNLPQSMSLMHLFFISGFLSPKVISYSLINHSSPTKSTKSTKGHLSSLTSLSQIHSHTQPTTGPPFPNFGPTCPRCSCCLPWSPSMVSARYSLSPFPFFKFDSCRQMLPTMFGWLFHYFGLSTWSKHESLAQVPSHTQTPPNIVYPNLFESNVPAMDHCTSTFVSFDHRSSCPSSLDYLRSKPPFARDVTTICLVSLS